jgi:predicted glycosyltransferase
LIDTARGYAAIACSVRDIIVAKRDPRRIDAIVELIKNEFDMVLVHGDEALVEFSKTFPAVKQIELKLRYTGYVTSGAPETIADADVAQGEVLVSAGGGTVGSKLLSVALEARALGALKEHNWRILTGKNLPESGVSALKKQAGDHESLVIERFRKDFPSLLTSCSVSISQAGYNTIVDLLVARARAIVVPFSTDSETEQTLRSHLLEKRGLVTVIQDAELSAQLLAKAITDVSASQRPQQSRIALDGAARSADILYDLAMDARKN